MLIANFRAMFVELRHAADQLKGGPVNGIVVGAQGWNGLPLSREPKMSHAILHAQRPDMALG